jgi:SHS family lactate transporter-like MFS transporter
MRYKSVKSVQSVDSEVNFAADRANQRNALAAGFLGWTLDAFDFFVLTYVLGPVAYDFRLSIPDIALTLTASLAMRPVGAFIFGLMADRYGRRLPMALDVAFYTVVEVLSGIAPNYATFFVLRLLYGIGMGGEWGVGASLAMESVSARWRGTLSGLLQEGYAFGSLLAAMAYYVVFPRWGWRPLFFIGAVPAAVTLLVLARVRETEAWRQSRTGWAAYRSTMFQNWKLFLYLVLLMTMMNFMSHGTQDLYPTFLQRQRHFDARLTATTSMISMAGAIFGGLAFGWYSDRRGRRRAMVTATLLAALLTPLWILAPNLSLIALGAFLIQFMVQGAWGVIPAHINELSPASLRGFFPGFAYQLGVLCASSIGYVEAVLGEHFSYAPSMGILAATALLAGAAVIALGPEAHAVKFSG